MDVDQHQESVERVFKVATPPGLPRWLASFCTTCCRAVSND